MHLALTFLPNHALEHQLRFQLFYSQFSRDSYNFYSIKYIFTDIFMLD